MKKIILASVLCASAIFAASEPSEKYSYELTPFVSGILSDSKINLDDDNYANVGIALAKNLGLQYIDQVEASYMRSDSLEYKGANGNTNINRFFLNAIKKYPLTERLAAYGLVGLGYQDVSQEISGHDDGGIFNYGVGLKYDIPYYGIALKGDIRHLIAFEETQSDFMYTVGLAMPLGKKSSDIIAPVIPTVVEPVVEAPAQIVDGDDDNDGVLNSKDLCPDTVPGAIVDRNGCELDDDNDGVVNRLDKCPNTSPGVKVNAEGCVNTVNLRINFDYNSANVKNEYNADLEAFANMLKANPKLTAVIEAHTDSKGSDAYNQKLSEKRATSAVNALRELNVNGSRLTAVGYGESQPIASNDTEEGRAANRRVTALINE